MGLMSELNLIDFEFNNTKESPVNLVSCVTEFRGETKKWWLHNSPETKEELKSFLLTTQKLASYSVIAEARSFIALGLNPLDFKWVDLYLEYRLLSNHNDKIQYGKHLSNGRIVQTKKPPPKWQRTTEEEKGFVQTFSLVEATYKFLGIQRDQTHKDKMRDLILSDPPRFTDEEKELILNYGVEDVKDLYPLLKKMVAIYFKLNPGKNKLEHLENMFSRGEYAAHTAVMEEKGYPFDYEKTLNFSRSVSSILYECQKEINELFPSVKPFRWEKKTSRYTWDQKATRSWVESNCDVTRWERTEKGALSLSLEAFERFFPFKHEYPKDSFGAQMVRFLKLKQSLYGFVPAAGGKKRTFWDSVGSDKRVRPYFGIYGSQSSRSQPASTGFLALKPAWMRSLIQPKKGKALGSIDYGSQEFFISALLSQDKEMIKAYLSGDVYLAFAKATNMVPQNATKDSHRKERNLAKFIVLGMSYSMSKVGLSNHLTQHSGKVWSEDEAQGVIDDFYSIYSDFYNWQQDLIDRYQTEGFLELPDGWTLWGDNDNFRSFSNFPVQGLGAYIMREAVKLCFKRGLYVCFTLHDALYVEFDSENRTAMRVLRDCMVEAFYRAFPKEQRQYAEKIKLDPFAWSPDYVGMSEIDFDGYKVEVADKMIDDRAISEYEKFKASFEPGDSESL